MTTEFQDEDETTRCEICKEIIDDPDNADYNDDNGCFCCQSDSCLKEFWAELPEEILMELEELFSKLKKRT